jgi:hypothetical protein
VVRALALASAGVLLGAAAFELALALGAWSIGAQPGDSAKGQVIVGPAAFLSLLLGVLVAGVGATKRERTVSGLAPSVALFVTATVYTYDPYYAPALRRYADGGSVPVTWIFALLAISFAVAAFTWRWPREGGWITAITMFVWAVTLVFAGDGH